MMRNNLQQIKISIESDFSEDANAKHKRIA
jgi:hypothetical protein